MVLLKRVFLSGLSMALIACSSPEELGAQIVESEGENAQDTLDRRIAHDSDPVEFRDEQSEGDAARDFTYGWPAQVSAIAPLAAMLAQERDEHLTKQRAEWEQSVEEFAHPQDGFQCISCVNRSYSKNWKVSAETPRFLVLTGETFTYTGGAHGNSFFDALAWDREAKGGAGEALRPVDLFVDEVALENTAYGDYCQALLDAKREKLDIDITAMNPFDGCPSVSELVVVPLSSDGRTFDSVRFLAAPYVAGSYAEGPYEFEIPITPALLEVVKPRYRAEFSAGE